jgi:hypothetical protein
MALYAEQTSGMTKAREPFDGKIDIFFNCINVAMKSGSSFRI